MRGICVHHTGSGPARPTVEDTARFAIGATAQLPFPQIAYTLYVEADGTLELCHSLHVIPWSQGDGSATVIALDGVLQPDGTTGPGQVVGSNNVTYISVCFSGEHPTPAQRVTIKRVWDAARAAFGSGVTLRAHREVSGRADTECCGDLGVAYLHTIGDAA